MDMSIPPIDISISKQSNWGDEENDYLASCEADAALEVEDPRSETDQDVKMAYIS